MKGLALEDFRTPTARARGLGAARGGTRDFWYQRVTSVLGVLLIASAIIVVIDSIGADYDDVRALLSNPVVVALLLLALLNFCIHMRIGTQVIIEDYVHQPMAKVLFLIVNAGFSTVIGVVGAVAVMKIALSG